MAYPSDLARTKDWGTEVLTDADLEGQLDLIINWVMAALDASTGHKHDGTANESQKIDTGGIDNDAITFALIDDDGDFGLFTGDWSFNEIALVEDSAPATAASEMKLYTKDTGGQPELFVREESNGDEVQLTSGGSVEVSTGAAVQVVNTQTGTYSNPGNTVIPIDNTKPLWNEGETDGNLDTAITPKSATNKLKIEVTLVYSFSGAGQGTIALFQDPSGSDAAIAAVCVYANGNQDMLTTTFTHYMAAGTTNATTFKVRAGTNGANQVYFNGRAAGIFNGVAASSVTITEIKV